MKILRLTSIIGLAVGGMMLAAASAEAFPAPASAPQSDALQVEQTQYYGYRARRAPRGWYPGKGMRFCQANPGDYRCRRGRHRHYRGY